MPVVQNENKEKFAEVREIVNDYSLNHVRWMMLLSNGKLPKLSSALIKSDGDCIPLDET